MTIPAGTAVFFVTAGDDPLQTADDVIFKKVQYVEAPTTIYYVHLNAFGIPTSITSSDTDPGGYQPAAIASSFTLYADGSLAEYRYNNMETGDYVRIDYAEVPASQRQVFGEDNQYSNGPVTYSETLKDNVKEIRSFTDGKPTFVSIEKINSSSLLKLEGLLSPTGFATVTLTNDDHPTGLQLAGAQGTLLGLLPINAAQLVTDNGAGLIGNDGSTLVGPDGGTFNAARTSSLITDYGAGLIGNDGSTMVPVYNSLIGNDGSTVIARDGAGFTLDAAAMMRGYRAYSGPSNFTELADDFGGNIAGAGTVAVGGSVTGELEVESDRDWFAVTLDAGRSYTFSLSGIDGGGGLLGNPHLALHDAEGNVVEVNSAFVFDDDGGIGRDARLTFTPTDSGTFYLVASASADNQRGTYELSVEADPPTAFVKSSAALTISDGVDGGGVVMAAITSGVYAGGFVVAWVEKDNSQHPVASSGDYFIQIQIVTADGTRVDLDARPEFTTYSPGNNNRAYDADDYDPSIAMFDDGSFVVSWTDQGYNNPKTRTHYVTVNADGTPNTEATMIPDAPSGQVVHGSSGADVVTLNNGNWLTILHRWGIDGPIGNAPETSNLQVSVNGATPSAAAIDADTDSPYGTSFTTSATRFGNGAIAVWTEGSGDAGNNGEPGGYASSIASVRGAVLSASGTVLASFDVNQHTDYAQFIVNGSQVADIGGGRFVVAFTSGEYWPTGDSHAAVDSYFRVFSYDDGDVEAVTDDIAIEGEQDGIYVDNATVVALPSGGFAIVYGRDGEIRMQVYNDDGDKIGIATKVAVNAVGTAAVALDDGRVAVSFMQDGVIKLQYMEPNSAPHDITLSADHIAENSLQGTIVGTLSATDANGGDSFTYSLVDPDGWFYLDGNTLRFDDNVDHVTKHLDHETEATHDVTVRVTDSAGISYDETFTIDVHDVDEWPTGLEDTSASVTENASVGTLITTLSATDEDGHGPFSYSIVDGDGQPITGLPFEIVGNEIRVTGPINAEVQSAFYFYVRISDGTFTTDDDVNSEHPDVSFYLNVENVDDAAPTNLTLSIFDYDGVDEGLAAGTDVGSLSVDDLDTYNPADFTFEILNSDGTFRLETDQYGYTHLFTNTTLDYETASRHQVTVRVSDPSAGHYDKTLTVDVEDIDEVPSIVGGNTTKIITVPVGTSYNTVLYSIVATDPEGDELGYGTDSAGYFDFNVDDAGHLYFNNTAAFPTTYNFRVFAGDDGGHYVYQNVQVVVTAASVNHAPDIIGNLNIGYSINENTTQVKVLSATDADNDTLTWQIVGGPDADKFQLTGINNNNVGLVFKTAPDFENPTDVGHNNAYNVIVRAMDPTGAFDTQSLEISIADVADTTTPPPPPPPPPPANTAPAITSSGGGDGASINVMENAIGIVAVTATDPEDSPLTYSIASGADADDFVIDAATGMLSFRSPADFENPTDANGDNVYSVTVAASDGTLADTQALTITVLNDKSKPKAGTNKDDKLNGTDKEETLDGKQGNDTIKAKAGGDTIIGGAGADKLYGGVDGVTDTFVFLKGDSGKTEKTWDQIFDFVSGIDKIDLSGIDGDPKKGHQELRFVTKFKDPGKKTDGQFRVVDDGKHVNVEIDLDGNKKADMIIHVMNVDQLLATDFIV